MKKYLVLYHAPASLQRTLSKMTPEQQSAGMKGWMDWAGRVGNKLVDMGSPLANGKSIKQGGGTADSKKSVGGYSILQAENMKELKSLLKNHPHLMWNKAATIEVHEFMPIAGM